MSLDQQFNQSKFDQYQSYLNSSNLSRATIRRKLASLYSFQKYLAKQGLLQDSTLENKHSKLIGLKDPKRITFDIKNPFQHPSFAKYLAFSSIAILFLGLGIGLYTQTITKAKKKYAYSTSANPIRPGRQLSFQARLTDTAGDPITSSTNINFKLYTANVGGTLLYNSNVGNSQTVTPDQNGIFAAIIGKTHGLELSQDVFTNNAEVWLEITAGGETMTPRQQIATVAYALNSETLQGLAPSASGMKDTVLVIDGQGNLNLGETSPTIKSVSGTMGIEGQALLLKASDGSGGNIEINPDASGIIKLTTEGATPTTGGFINATNANLLTGNLFNGQINNVNRGYNFIEFKNYNIGTTLLGSRFSVSAAGNVNIGGTYFGDGSGLTNITASSVSFGGITSGTNTIANMVVGTGASLTYTGNGIINANRLAGLDQFNLPYIFNSGNNTLIRSGVGTSANPYTLALNLGSTNSWLAQQDFSTISIGNTILTANASELNLLDGTLSTNGSIIYGNGSNLTNLAIGTSNYVLLSNGTTPIWVDSSTIGRTYTANNGIGLSGNTFQLGGDLIKNTRLNIGNTEVMFFNFANGNIGLGTTAPGNYKININGSQYISGTLDARGNVNIGTSASGNTLTLYSNTSDRYAQWQNSNNRLYLKQSDIYFDNRQLNASSPVYPSPSSGFTWGISTDSAGMNVFETASDQLEYQFSMTDNPGSNDRYSWISSEWSSSVAGYEGMELKNGTKTTINQNTDIYGGLNVRGAAKLQNQFLQTINGGSSAPMTSYPILMDTSVGDSAADFTQKIYDQAYWSGSQIKITSSDVDLSQYTSSASQWFIVKISDSATNEFKWASGTLSSPTRYNFGVGQTTNTNWISLDAGGGRVVRIRFSKTLADVANNFAWGFRVIPGGNLIVDTNLIYANTVTDRVGIGTASPNYKLEVAGDALVSTRLGIGTTNINYALNVNGSANITNGLVVGAGTTINGNLNVGGTIFGDGSGLTNITASSVNFAGITSGTNTSANMIVGTGASLSATGTGVINATQLNGLDQFNLPYVLNTSNGTLTRSGVGTSANPYTLALNLGSTNIWTAPQTFNNNISVGGTSFLTTLSIGNTIVTTNATRLNYLSNVNNTNGSLIYGNGTGFANTNVGASGQILMSNGANAPFWVNTSEVGSTYNANNGIGMSGNIFQLGGPIIKNTRLNIGNTDVMFIDYASGNIGFGATSPQYQLQLSKVVNPEIAVNKMGSNMSGIFRFDTTNNQTFIQSLNAGFGYLPIALQGDSYKFFTGNVESVRIDTSGNFGIGTTNPIGRLNVTNGDAFFGVNAFGVGRTTALTDVHVDGNLDVGGTIWGDFAGNLLSGISFNKVTSGLNIGNTLVVGNGSSLTATGTGIIDANRFGGYTTANLPYVNDTGDSTLIRIGSGPYTLQLNLGSTNTWSAPQTFANNINVGGTSFLTTLSLGNTIITTNATRLNYLSNVNNTAGSLIYGNGTGFANTGVGISGQVLMSNASGSPFWVNASEVGTTFVANNGIGLSGSTFQLGGALIKNTRLNIGNTEVQYFDYSTGNIGMGNTAPGIYKLNITGSQYISNNLVVGTGTTINGNLNVGGTIFGQFAGTFSGNLPFSQISSGLNIGNTLVIGNGSSLSATGTGVINATQLNGLDQFNLPYVLNTSNGTLTRSGVGTSANPYTLALNLGSTNIWTAPQTFNNNAYVLGNIGLGTTAPGSKLSFAASTVAAGGILFGSDTNLYRSAADTLRTDDTFSANSLSSANISSPDNSQWSFLQSTSLVPLIYNKDIIQDHLQFNFPTTAEYQIGGTWASTAIPYTAFTGQGTAGFTIMNGWEAYRLSWNNTFPYRFFEDFYSANSTNGHTATIAVEQSNNGVGWTSQFTTSAISSWPGHVSYKKNFNTNGTPYFRITITPTWNGAYPTNNINIYQLRYFGGYTIDGANKVYTWDYNRNALFNGAIRGVTGNSTTPTFSFTGDTDTGIFSGGANIIKIGTGGTERFSINNFGDANFGVGAFGVGRTTALSDLHIDGNLDVGGTIFGQFAGTFSGTLGFNQLTSGTNTSANMIVGTGASLSATGTGVINATQLNGLDQFNLPYIFNASNGTLTRSGVGTSANPYTLALNLGSSNTWTALQTFGNINVGNTANIATLSLGGTNVLTNATRLNYLSGINNTAGSLIYADGTGFSNSGVGASGQILMSNGANAPFWVSSSSIGTTYSANNGIGLSGSTFQLGGPLIQNTRLNIGNTEVMFFDYATGRVGIGNTAPGTYKLNVTGNINTSGDFTIQGGDIYDNSGNLSLAGEDNVYIKLDYNNNDADTRSIIFAKNTNIGAAPTAANELMRISENGNVGIGATSPMGRLQVLGGDVFFGNTAFGVGRTTALTDLKVDGNLDVGGTIFGQFAGTFSGTLGFNQLTSGTNTSANMIVGTGASLSATGTGVINATQLNGLNQFNLPYVLNATNTTLTRSGVGTSANPYTLALNLGSTNTWLAPQTINAQLTINGGEVWTFNNNNNPRYVLGDSPVSGQYGTLRWDSALDEMQLIHSITNASFGVGDSYARITNNGNTLFYGNSAGNVGIGNTTPLGRLNVTGGDVIFGTTAMAVGRTTTNTDLRVDGNLDVGGTIFGQFSGTFSGNLGFNQLTSGTNTTANMVVGTGASLSTTGNGIINANRLGGVDRFNLGYVLNATNGTLTRSGVGTSASPYTLGLNLGNANTWTALQTLNGGLTVGNTLTANNSIIGNKNITSFGLVASNVGASSSMWTKVGSFKLNSQYANIQGFVQFTGGATGNTPAIRGQVYFRVKQQNVMGGLPYLELESNSNNTAITKDDFKLVTIQNDVTATVAELWIRTPASWEQIKFNPTLISGPVADVTWFENQGLFTTTPVGTGTSIVATNSNGTFNNLVVGAGATVNGNLNVGGTIFGQFSGTFSGNLGFNQLISGTNTVANMVVGAGASLSATGTGVINATQLGGVDRFNLGYVLNATNGTLTRSGVGTSANPYTLALNLGSSNTWTALQTFGNINVGNTANIATLSLGGTNVLTNATRLNYLSGINNTAGSLIYGTGSSFANTGVGASGQILMSNGANAPFWVNAASVGSTYSANNGIGISGSYFQLGGPIVKNTRLNIGNTEVMFFNFANGNIGIGNTSPGAYKLNITGNGNFGGNLNLTGLISQNGTTRLDASGNLTNIGTFNGYNPARSASSLNSIYSLDSRATNYEPDDRNAGLYVDFKQNGVDALSDGGSYHGSLTFRSYGSGADLSGGNPMQLSYTENGNLWTRLGVGATNWGTWRQLATDQMTRNFSYMGNLSVGVTNTTQKLQVTGGDVIFGNTAMAVGRTTTNTDLRVDGNLDVGGTIFGTVVGTITGTITFDQLDSGTNTTANMVVGTGASLSTTGNGIINANRLGGVDRFNLGYVLNATNGTLTRSGVGTSASPYTLGLNLGSTNTWTAPQSFNNSAYITGGRLGVNTVNPKFDVEVAGSIYTSSIGYTHLAESFSGGAFPPANFTTGIGNSAFSRDASTFFDTAGSAQGRSVGSTVPNNGMAWMETGVTLPSNGTLTYNWRVSSEPSYDYLLICIDRATCNRTVNDRSISGTVGWTQVSMPLTAGSHIIRWGYAKDGSAINGTDQGWVDNIVFSTTSKANILTDGAIGIGTTSPLGKMQVSIGNTQAFFIGSNGNIAIGHTTPTQKLDILGNMKLSGALFVGTGTTGAPGQILASTGVGLSWINNTGTVYSANNGIKLTGSTFGLGGTLAQNTDIGTSSYFLSFKGIGNSQSLHLASNGNVSIGTTNSNGYKLYVLGNQYNNGNLTVGGTTAITTLSLGGTNVTTNATRLNYLSSLNNTAGSLIFANGSALSNTGVGVSGQLLMSNGSGTPFWVNSSSIGTTFAFANGLKTVSANTIGLGGTLTQNTQIGTSSFSLSFLGLGNTQGLFLGSNGNVSIGTTATGAKLTINTDMNNWAGMSIGRTGTEMSIGVAAGAGNGLQLSQPGDIWIKNLDITKKFFLGSGTGVPTATIYNNSFGIGTTNPIYPLTVSSTSGLPSGNAAITIIGDSNKERFESQSVGGAGGGTPTFQGWSGRGTLTTKSATGTDDILLNLAGAGTDNTGARTGNLSLIQFGAAENYTTTNNGSDIRFITTPLGSLAASRLERMRITASGYVGIGTSSPIGPLHIGSGLSTSLLVGSNGNVSVGTTKTSLGKLSIASVGDTAAVGVANLITANGTFAAATGWTLGANWTVAGGKGVHSTGSTAPMTGTSTATSNTTMYQITFDVGVTTAGAGFGVSLGGKDTGAVITTSGPVTLFAKPTNLTGTISFNPIGAGTFVGNIDNVTIRAITTTSSVLSLLNQDSSIGIEMRTGGLNNNNTFLGLNSGRVNTTGWSNTGIGSLSLSSNTSGYNNAATGYQSLQNNTTGANNSAFGMASLYSNTSGSSNTALGSYSLYTNTSAGSNTAVGYNALRNNNAAQNTALGNAALMSNTTGGVNTALGSNTLENNISGWDNIAIGTYALRNNITGDQNIAIGTYSLINSTGSRNFGLGKNSMLNLVSGNGNVAYGNSTLGLGTTLNSNIALGHNAGYNLSIGSSNIFLGVNSGAAGAYNNKLFIGHGQNPTIYGDLSNQRLGLGTTSPQQKLDIVGNIRINGTIFAGAAGIGTTGGNNQVLASDGAGSMKWINPSTSSYTAGNGTSMVGTNVELGGNLTRNTQIGTSSFSLNFGGVGSTQSLFLSSNGNVSIGQTNVSYGRLSILSLGDTSVTSGGNLLTADGTFTAATGWTVGAGWSIGGVATHTPVNTGTLSGTSNATNISQIYQVTFTLAVTTGANGLNVSLGGQDSGMTFYTAGTKTVYIRPTAATGALVFTPVNPGDFNGTIDNVTINTLTSVTPAFAILNKDSTVGLEIRSGGSGKNNSFIGINSGRFNTSGYNNTTNGNNALYYNTTGYANSAFGNSAMNYNTAGSSNSALGINSLYNNTTGNNNSAFGYSSLYNNTYGSSNSSMGTSALFSNLSGNFNSALGNNALYNMTGGNGNIAFGYRAGYNLGVGTSNIFIGNENGAAGNYNGRLYIGNGQNPIIYGDLTTGNLSIGTTYSTYKLNVNGQPAANGYTAFTNYSDARLKTDINYLSDGVLDKLMQIKPATFKYNELTGYDEETRSRTITGFIAQELQAIFPNMVGKVKIGGTEYLDTNLSALQIYTIKGIQEQQGQINDLKSKLSGLSVTENGQINTNMSVAPEVLHSLGYSGAKNELESASYSITDSLNNTVTSVANFNKLAVAKLNAGFINVKNMVAENIVVKNFIAEKSQTNELNVNLISPVGSSDTVTVKSNLKVEGDLTVKTATVSTLYAENIISKEGSIGDLMTNKISALKSEMQQIINENLGSTVPSITESQLLTDSQNWSYDVASKSAKINGNLTLSDNLVIGSQLLVQGDSRLANAYISGTFQAGEVQIKNNIIETTNTALYIQPSGTGSVNIMNNLFIAQSGEILINGNLKVNGNFTANEATISGSLIANMLDARTIKTDLIETNKIKVSTDSATGMVIADSIANPTATTSASLTSNATAGMATLPAGIKELNIRTDKLTANSMVYLTPNGSTQNQVLYVKNKVGDTFTVALDTALTSDLQLNWWIIN